MALDELRRPLFGLGQIVVTPGAVAALAVAHADPAVYLSRHRTGDWGTLEDDDWKTNNYALTHAGRLLSAYRLSTGTTLWIVTEADRATTTLLLPDEY
jgi:hypothetical protein